MSFLELVTALQTVGLQVNYDKTVVIVPTRLWEDARYFKLRNPDHPLCKCRWQDEGLYLRRPFRPYGPAMSVSGWVAQSASKLAHAGWEELGAVLRQCKWSQGLLPFTLINR